MSYNELHPGLVDYTSAGFRLYSESNRGHGQSEQETSAWHAMVHLTGGPWGNYARLDIQTDKAILCNTLWCFCHSQSRQVLSPRACKAAMEFSHLGNLAEVMVGMR